MENSVPSFLFPDVCKIVEIKISGKTQFENLLKQLFHSPLLDMEVIITNSGSWNDYYIIYFVYKKDLQNGQYI